jgi:hypothetical protein
MKRLTIIPGMCKIAAKRLKVYKTMEYEEDGII